MTTTEVLNRRFVKPEIVSTHFHLRPGDKVADFGAGSGYFVRPLSKLVGSEGRVYACEIQRSLVETIADIVRQESTQNVEVIWCDFETEGGTKIDDGALDAGVVVNTLFQIGNKSAAIKEFVRTLRPGGKLFIVDWMESWGGLGPQPEDVVNDKEAVALCESGGLVFERDFDAGDHHYGLAFRKP